MCRIDVLNHTCDHGTPGPVTPCPVVLEPFDSHHPFLYQVVEIPAPCSHCLHLFLYFRAYGGRDLRLETLQNGNIVMAEHFHDPEPHLSGPRGWNPLHGWDMGPPPPAAWQAPVPEEQRPSRERAPVPDGSPITTERDQVSDRPPYWSDVFISLDGPAAWIDEVRARLRRQEEERANLVRANSARESMPSSIDADVNVTGSQDLPSAT
ncbi:hypothetical protein PVAG01_05272 [Phlyctema vagabunda]|uniref:Uncharacterized protein n=1 Tax=Phlyctema vagabunda TaxID=108571 RepID=A0ABR4PJM0_9HELO